MTDGPIGLLLAVAVALVVLGWYLSYSAARLDRLHHKVETARAALDIQLVRRATAAVEVSAHLDPATALLLTDAATQALSAGEQADTAAARAARDPLDLPPELETVENDLTRAMRAAFPGPVGPEPVTEEEPPQFPPDPFAQDARRRLAQAGQRVQLARRFHNDAVAQAQRVRRKRVVRWARLAGRAPMPQMIELDDDLPPELQQ